MSRDELFGLIVAVQMLINIGLFLHNRHLASLVRDKNRIIEELLSDRAVA